MEQKSYEENEITPIGVTDWRHIKQSFGIKDKDRLGHIYVIGKTGVGKSTLLETMAISDIEKGKGMGLIDPHGDLCDHILHYIPKERIKDVIYFNPAEYPIAFNPLANIDPKYQHLAAAGIISTLKKIWSDSWGVRLEHILRFSLLTLLEYRNATLLDIQPLLTNPLFRHTVLTYVTSKHLLDFWHNEFDKYSPAFRSEAIAPILNKVGLFVASEPLRNTVGQRKESIQIKQIMEGKILLVNLSKGKLGEDASTLLGSMLVTAFQLAALSRSAQDTHTRTPFYLYIDEAHSFISLSFGDILAEARKYGLSLFLAHQYIEQFHEKIRSAIFGNVGTMIVFRVGAADSEYLAKEFHPIFKEDDLVNLPKYSMYIKLMIDGATSRPFSATTVPVEMWERSNKDLVLIAAQKKAAELQAHGLQDNQYPKVDDRKDKPMTLF